MSNEEALRYWRELQRDARRARRDAVITACILVMLTLSLAYALLK